LGSIAFSRWLTSSTTLFELSTASAGARIIAPHFGAFSPVRFDGRGDGRRLGIPRGFVWVETGPPFHTRHSVRNEFQSAISFELGKNSFLTLGERLRNVLWGANMVTVQPFGKGLLQFLPDRIRVQV
jgi:hypothetical protein